MMRPFDFHLRTRVVFGGGSVARVGELARELGFTRTLLVADRGVLAEGYVEHAAACAIDSIVALGGGSSLDCAKGINFVLTNGGTMRDYWGFGKAARPML